MMWSDDENNKDGEKVIKMVRELNANIVIDGGMKQLPLGFRFQPTEKEIVFQYLVPKVFSSSHAPSILPHFINISNFNPWDLPGDWEQDRYFFSKRECKHGINGKRAKRRSSDGYWKSTGFDKQITRSCCSNGGIHNPISRKKDIISGMKKTLVFYKTKPNRINVHHHMSSVSTRTRWMMHEYRLVHSPTTSSNINKENLIQMGNWELCHIYLNKRSRKIVEEDDDVIESSSTGLKKEVVMLQDFMRKDDEIDIEYEEATSSSSSSCGSSVIHEVSSSTKLLDDEEIKNVFT